MKLCLFSVNNSFPYTEQIGAIFEDKVVDLAAAYRSVLRAEKIVDINRVEALSESLIPRCMTAFIEGGEITMDAAKRAYTFAQQISQTEFEKHVYELVDVKLHAPLKKPPTVRDFLSFELHYQNSLGGNVPEVWYERPIYYKTVTSTIIGPEEICQW